MNYNSLSLSINARLSRLEISFGEGRSKNRAMCLRLSRASIYKFYNVLFKAKTN